MAKYITEIDVTLNKGEEQVLKSRGFERINVDLNTGAGGNDIFLWYKRGYRAPITRMQMCFTIGMGSGLAKTGYTRIPKNLNAGTKGDAVYLWYYSGSTDYDTPITDLNVTVRPTDEAALYKFGWERVGCDMNRRSGGGYNYVWLKRERQTYICDIFASDSSDVDADLFTQGYTRVDADLNRDAEGALIFLWYRQTTSNESALSCMEISTNNSEFRSFQQQCYEIVNVNLNDGTRGDNVYLWYKRDASLKPIQALSVLINEGAVDPYLKAGIQVIKRNLNSGNHGTVEYLAYYH